MIRNRFMAVVLLLLALVVTACGSGSAPAAKPADTKPAAAPAPAAKPATPAAPAPAPAPAKAPVQQKLMNLGAVAATSTNYILSVEIAKAINTEMPELKMNVLETAGGTENTKKLAQNQIELGLAGLSGLDNGLYGDGPFKDAPIKDLRLMFNVSVLQFHYVVRADSNIKSMADMNGKKINPAAVGTSTEQDVLRTYDAMGIKPDFFKASQNDGVQAFRDKRIDGFVKGGQVPESVVTEISATVPVRLIGLTAAEKAKIEAKYPFIPMNFIAGGKYKGNDQNLTVPAIVTSYGSRASLLTEAQAYGMIKAMYKHRDAMKKVFPAFDMDFDKLTASTGRVPLHAGAVKFLVQDRKIEVPKNLIPPEYKG